MNAPSPVLRELAPRLYWLLLVVAAWLLLRGHHEPGGGFVGGLVALAATVVRALAFGSPEAARRLPLRSPAACAALGVLLSLLSGLPAALGGAPFLTHPWVTVAGVSLSTVMLFDLGVLLAVWGGLGGYALALLDLDRPGEDR